MYVYGIRYMYVSKLYIYKHWVAVDMAEFSFYAPKGPINFIHLSPTLFFVFYGLKREIRG